MRKTMLLLVTIITALLTLLSCSSINHSQIQEETSFYYECKEKDKATYHYFSNHFFITPTEQEKADEVPLAILRLKCRLGIVLHQCKEIPKSEIPDDLTK
jgi:hypothetical protein